MFNDEIPVGKADNLKEKRFNRLTVLYRVKNIGRNTAWKCQCDCGNYVTVMASHLKDGHTKSCGCLQKEKVIEKNKQNNAHLTNKRFGRLLVLQPTEERKNNDIVWKCQCDCGKIHYTTTSSLTSGSTKSCGCLRSEVSTQHFKKIGKLKASNLIGKKFGKLTVINSTEERKNRNIIWQCQCDCGNICYVPTTYLQTGDTSSCGCLTSKGELKILELLQQSDTVYQTQKTFDTCIYPETKSKLRFDFYINDNYLIEYDGIQHFKATGYGWNTDDNLIYLQQRDAYKNQWCKDNNIPLIRIPYTKLNTLRIEDLMLETTQFRVV